jgi:hypothetical protein
MALSKYLLAFEMSIEISFAILTNGWQVRYFTVPWNTVFEGENNSTTSAPKLLQNRLKIRGF